MRISWLTLAAKRCFGGQAERQGNREEHESVDAGFQRRGGHHHQTREHEHQYHLVTRASGSKAESGGGGPGAAGRRAGREEELAGACRAQSAHGEAYADDEPPTGDGNDETDAGQNGKSRQLRQQQQPRRGGGQDLHDARGAAPLQEHGEKVVPKPGCQIVFRAGHLR